MDNTLFFAIVTATSCLISGVVTWDLSKRRAERQFSHFLLRLRSTLQYGGHSSAVELINVALDDIDYRRRVY